MDTYIKEIIAYWPPKKYQQLQYNKFLWQYVRNHRDWIQL